MRRGGIISRTLSKVRSTVVSGNKLLNSLPSRLSGLEGTRRRLAGTRSRCGVSLRDKARTRRRITGGGLGATSRGIAGTGAGISGSSGGTVSGVAKIAGTVTRLKRTSMDLSSFKSDIKSLISMLSRSKSGVNKVVTTVLTVLSRVNSRKLSGFIKGVLRAIDGTMKKVFSAIKSVFKVGKTNNVFRNTSCSNCGRVITRCSGLLSV